MTESTKAIGTDQTHQADDLSPQDTKENILAGEVSFYLKKRDLR